MEKMLHNLYGKHFTLETGQKLHETILQHSLFKSTPRLQWLLVKTIPYSFNLKYIVGNQQVWSFISGMNSIEAVQYRIQLLLIHINHIKCKLPQNEDNLEKICMNTSMNDTPALLMHHHALMPSDFITLLRRHKAILELQGTDNHWEWVTHSWSKCAKQCQVQCKISC